jgi:tetratricopeptide (TPR) repeat protein
VLFLFKVVREFYFLVVTLVLLVSCKEQLVKEPSFVIEDESSFKHALKEDSLNPDLWSEFGEFYIKKNNESKAIDCFEECFKIDSLNFKVSFVLSELYFKKVLLQKSQLHLKNCLKLDSLQTQPYLNLAQLFIFKSDYKSAFKYINSGLRINNHIPQAYFMKGVCYKHLRDTVKALSSFKTAIEIDPNYFASYPEIGLILTSQNDSNGIHYYRNALEVSPKNSEAWFGLAWSYQAFDKSDLAMKEYEGILDSYPNFIDAKFNLGLLRLDNDELSKAKKLFFEVVNQQPKNIDAYYNLYKCFSLEGAVIKAQEFKTIVLELNPEFFTNDTE